MAQDKLYAALVADAEDNIQAEQVATGVAEIPLTEDERAAVEEGASAIEQLVDVPAPAGPTPGELATGPRFVPPAQLSLIESPGRPTATR